MDGERDTPPVDVTVQQIGNGGTRGMRLPMVLVALGIAVAIVKPWSSGQEPGGGIPSAAPLAVVAGSAPASAQPSAADAESPTSQRNRDMLVICASPSSWSVATLQQWAGRKALIRTWTVIEPVSALGPEDPSIPTVPIAADGIAAIGYCAPTIGRDGPPTGATGELYRIDATGAYLQRAIRLEPSVQDAFGVLWTPGGSRRGSSSSRQGWPAGTYVVHIADRDNLYDQWLGAEIRITLE